MTRHPIAIAAVVFSLLVTGCVEGDTTDPSPTSTARQTPPTPDVQALVGDEASVTRYVNGDMDADGTDELVIASQTEPTGDEIAATPHLQAFMWDDGWTEIYDAADPDAEQLIGRDATVGEEIAYVNLIDLDPEPDDELVVAVQRFGATAGPLHLSVLELTDGEMTRVFEHQTERGGQVSATDEGVVLETGDYQPEDPRCCPSAMARHVIAHDPQADEITIVETTTTPTGEAPDGS